MTGSVFPANRAAFDPANQDMVWGYAQSHPLDYVLTSDEAIGTYSTTYNWAQVAALDAFSDPHPVVDALSSPAPTGPRLLRSETPQLWQAWWVGTTDYARMDAKALTAFLSRKASDPSPRLNQLLDTSPLAQQAGFAPDATAAGFYEGNHDDEDATAESTFCIWILAIFVAFVLVQFLRPLACKLAERQLPLLAALRDRERGRGSGRGRVVGALALQALAPTGLALVAGGLLALLLARFLATLLLPVPVRPVVNTLVSGPLDTGYSFGVAGGLAAVVLTLAAVLLMLHAMRYATRRAMMPELATPNWHLASPLHTSRHLPSSRFCYVLLQHV